MRPSLAALCFAASLAACSDTSAPAPAVRFVFRESLTGDAIRIYVNDPTARAEAERLLQSGEERWVVGPLLPGNGGFNAPWTWRLDPTSISFAEVTIEACQTAASAIANDIDYWIGFGQVCIWGVVESAER